MALEDFTSYTEVDDDSCITVQANFLDINGMPRNNNNYVYADKGVGHFAADFEHLLQINSTFGPYGIGCPWVVANDVEDFAWLSAQDKYGLALYLYSITTLNLHEIKNSGQDGVSISANTDYWLKIARVGNVTTCYIYSNSERKTLVDSIAVTEEAYGAQGYRYIYPVNNYDDDNIGLAATFDVRDLDLQEGAAAQTLTPAGLASTAAVGTPTLAPGPVTVAPAGLDTLGALGAVTLVPGGVSLTPAGLASLATLGTVTLAPGGVALTPDGLSSLAALGVVTLAPGAVTIAPTGLASLAALGVLVLEPGAVTVTPDGLASLQALGALTLAPGGVVLQPDGLASTAALGDPTFLPGPVTITPDGLASLAALGTVHLLLAGGALGIRVAHRTVRLGPKLLPLP